MDHGRVATQILEKVGGPENVKHVEHCSTRIRFTLADDSRVDLPGLKATPGILGVLMTGQCQVVIGNDVVEVYEKLVRLPGVGSTPTFAASTSTARRSVGAIVLDFLVGVFQPLIPAIAGAGVLKSVLLLLALVGWIDKTGQTYVVLASISDATFFFLPLMVAVTTATKLGANKLVALAAVGVLILPSMTALMAAEGGVSVFGFPITNVAYASQVFPAILSVMFLAVMERLWTRISPKPIRIFFVPMMSLLFTVPLTLVVLGPLGYRAGTVFASSIVALDERLGWVASVALAVALPFVIAVGMHKALVPYAVTQMGNTGTEGLYLPVSLAHNLAESGASFGVALRTRNTVLRPTAISAGISAAFGITEPALYGVTIQNKRALWAVLAGSAAGGAYIGITGVVASVLVGPGLASLSMFIDESNGMNVVHAIIGGAIAFGVSIVVAAILWREAEPAEVVEDATAPAAETPTRAGAHALVSPMSGALVPLSSVSDKVFAGGVMGSGFAIVPDDGVVLAPADGTVVTVFKTGHAVALKTNGGVEILVHVGIDTVKLDGRGFDVAVVKGQRVAAGDVLLKVDLAVIVAAGYDTTTPVVVLNSGSFEIPPVASRHVAAGQHVLDLMTKEPVDDLVS